MVNISVALVTRNRPESLNRCLESLRAQDTQPYEVIVSDDSDLDRAHETEAVAQKWNCEYISGPRRGLYANRNHAALACKGTHVRTMDDDHILPPGHIELCLRAVESAPNFVWTTGETVFFDGKKVSDYAYAGQLSPDGWACPVKDPKDNWGISDGSTIYPKEIFDSGILMVEEFGYGPSYLEFGAFLYRRGYKSRCIEGALVEHYPIDSALFSRGRSAKGLESVLFSSICYNLYFEPSLPLLLRYALPKFVRAGLSRDLILKTPYIFDLAKLRWTVGLT